MRNYNTTKKNRFQKLEERRKVIASRLKGTGLYVFRNLTSGDLHLAKKSIDGKTVVKPQEEWRGDSYYLLHVPAEASVVEVIRTNDDAPVINENTTFKTEERKEEMDKLILDQPDCVTQKGKVEHVLVQPTKKPLNEVVPQDPSQPGDMLINEDPMDGVEIIME
jgi:hypothetical protein